MAAMKVKDVEDGESILNLKTKEITGGYGGIELENKNDAWSISTGNISASNKNGISDGIVSNVYSGGKSDITAEDVKAEGMGTVTGISVNQGSTLIEGKTVAAGKGESTVKADSVTATATGNENVYGLNVKNGTVIIGEEPGVFGMVTVTGENGNAHGVKVRDGTVVVHGTGDTAISTTVLSEKNHVETDVYGIEALGESDVTVAGDVYVKARADAAIGVDASRNTSVTISKGNIVVDNESLDTSETGGIGISAYEAGERTVVNVKEGSVISKAGFNGGYGICANSDEGGVLSVAVAKDVTAVNGIGLELFGDGQGKKDILIEGTLSGDTAIMLDSEDSAKDTSLTVWKVESTGSNGIAAWSGNCFESADASEVISGAINYIVKTVQATPGLFPRPRRMDRPWKSIMTWKPRMRMIRFITKPGTATKSRKHTTVTPNSNRTKAGSSIRFPAAAGSC